MNFKENNGWENWQGQHPAEPANLLRKLWDASGSYKQNYRPNEADALASLKARMELHQTGRVVRFSPMKILLRVAAGIALLAVAVYAFNQFAAKPGKLTAAVTPVDSTKELSLADGSKITLNQSSQLSYKADFTEKERKVELQGEAYFDVARDEQRPFIIETQVGSIKVLGTSFNVRAYPSEAIFEVYVESGKVQVSLKNNPTPISLKPGEYLRMDKATNRVVRGKETTGMPLGWKTGSISFKGQTIPSIIAAMERLYGVAIKLEDEQSMDCLQTLVIQKGKMEEAIDVLKATCPNLKFSKSTAEHYEVTGICCK